MLNFLDTSVILNGGLSVFNNIYISPLVLTELEKIKTSDRNEHIKYLAREAVRDILSSSKVNIILPPQKEIDKILKKYNFLSNINDHRLLCEAMWLHNTSKEEVQFITSDGALALFSHRMPGINSLFWEKEDKKIDTNYVGWGRYYPNEEQMALLYSNPELNILKARTNEFCEVFEGNQIKDVLWWDGLRYKPLKYQEFKNAFGEKVTPRNLEQKMLFHLLQEDKTKIKLCLGGFGDGKAQPNNTLIPTPTGYKQLGDIKPGDYVFNRFGKPIVVTQIFPKGLLDNYKVTFSDGRFTYCNNEHLWSIVTSKGNLKTITLQEMIDTGLITATGKRRYKLPLTNAVEYPIQKYEIDPYVIGAFLGDGCCLEEALTLSSNDDFIVKEIIRLIKAKDASRNSINNYSWTFLLPDLSTTKNINRFQTKTFFSHFPELIQYSYNKKIPDIYKIGSIQQRLQLLQGLLDTDGTVDNKGRIKFTSTSYQLILDVQEILWSLGFKTTINIDNREDKYTKQQCYNLQIMGENKKKLELFRLPRKRAYLEKLLENNSKFSRDGYIYITNIEKMAEQQEMTCIMVDDPEHLYLTEQFIPTHNTWCMLQHALKGIKDGRFQKIIFVRNNIITKGSRDIGFLGGSLVEKIKPFLMPIADLTTEDYLDELIQTGVLEPVPLGFMRGRDFSNGTLVFCDEAENLTKENVQLLIGRIGIDSELWMCGDLKQIDHIDFEKNNGINKMIDCLAGNDLFGMVKLIKSERSRTSQLADLMD